MDRWLDYLFRPYGEETVRGWVSRLRMFRFFRAYGGLANDGDSLVIAFRYAGQEELLRFFAELGVPLVTFAAEPAQPQRGVSYGADEFDAFPSLVPGTQWVEQPGPCQLAGHKLFAWCSADQVRLTLASGYEVSEVDVAAAERLEPLLSGASLERVEPPIDNEHCVCPKYYPSYFV